MLTLISSLKLSTVPYAACSESRGHSRTAWLYIDVEVSLFVGFLISWISLPTKTTKISKPRLKVISQYSNDVTFFMYQSNQHHFEECLFLQV